MLLYIHVPFCRSKCHYCAFYSEPLVEGSALIHALSETPQGGTVPAVPQLGQDKLSLWLETLLLEMAHYSEEWGRPEVQTVFFGGGTPSLVPPDMIKLILDKASRYFRLDPKAEISLEANPESIHSRNAKAYLQAGVNRVSLGVQALDDDSLAVLGRVHNSLDVYRAFNALRAAGCRNINLDLIWALPRQSHSAWMAQLGEALRLKPEHISCYGLTLEAGTPMAQWREEGLFTLPQEREQAHMYVRGAEALEAAGLLHYEVSNFARMGYQCRHNVGYWEGQDYLGLGPSATSTVRGRRWTNPANLSVWACAVEDQTLGKDAETLNLTDRVLELLMLRLRTTRGLRFKAYRKLTGHDFLKDHKQLVTALHQNGLIRIRNGYIWLTRNGMLVSSSILERFFESAREKLQGADPGLAQVDETQAAIDAGLVQP